MAYSSRNIIVGAAAVYLSVSDSLSTGWNSVTKPAPVTGTPYADTLEASTGVWRSTGYTSAGLEFAYTPSYGEVQVDQLLDAAKMFKQKMTATLKTTFAEATLENLLVAWAQGDTSLRSAAGSTGQTDIAGRTVDTSKDFSGAPVPVDEAEVGIEAGALGVEPVERQVVFVGNSPRAASTNKKRERIYHIRRAISVDPTTHVLKQSEATLFPVVFRLLPSNVSGAEYGTVRDRVIS